VMEATLCEQQGGPAMRPGCERLGSGGLRIGTTQTLAASIARLYKRVAGQG